MNARTLWLKIHYVHNDWRRTNRMYFPSPAEVKFVRIMGGKTITISWIKHYKSKFPLVFFVTMGRTLRRELVQREYRVGGFFLDFAFVDDYSKKGIEIDGARHHQDIVKEQNRDDYLRRRGWYILHIRAVDLWRKPDVVRKRVKDFLAK